MDNNKHWVYLRYASGGAGQHARAMPAEKEGEGEGEIVGQEEWRVRVGQGQGEGRGKGRGSPFPDLFVSPLVLGRGAMCETRRGGIFPWWGIFPWSTGL